MKQQARVMVVDDNPLNLSLMEAVLLPEGYDVFLCGSGEECLELVRKNAPDIILLDAIMPNCDGFQVTRQLKADAATRIIPIVMVTSLSDTTDRVEALNSGVDDFLSKPVSEVELLARVRSLVKVKAFNDQLVESERRYRELVQDANVIIFTMNSHGTITFMNEYGLSFFGYTADELIGKAEIETILPEYESTGRNLRKISEDIKTNIQLYQRHVHENFTKLRRRVWVDWTNRYSPDRETGGMKLVCVGVDVTAAKRAEQERVRLYTRRRMREILNDGIHHRLSQVELLGELRQMGMELEPPFVFNLLAIPAQFLPEAASDEDWVERQHHIDLLIKFLHVLKLGAAWQAPAGIAIVHSLSEARTRSVSLDNAKFITGELVKKVSHQWLGAEITVGVSHSTDAAGDLSVLYEQARSALQYGPVLEKGKTVYHWHDLGYFQFLVRDLHSEQVQQFVQDHLGPIIGEKRAGSRAEDLALLEALVSGDSFQEIAERFHVHKQTIMFRKKKIEGILGVDLAALKTRMDLAIAMKIFSLVS